MNQSGKLHAVEGEIRSGKPSPLFATRGAFSGEINLQWDAVEGARTYVIQIMTNKKKKWVQVDIVTEPYYMLSRLDKDEEYSFRVAAVFAEGQGPWSEVYRKKVG